jgi:hypothetical protein
LSAMFRAARKNSRAWLTLSRVPIFAVVVPTL